jgi:hypothetical protein
MGPSPHSLVTPLLMITLVFGVPRYTQRAADETGGRTGDY